MIAQITKKLDLELIQDNAEALLEGRPLLKKITIDVIGQFALIEADLHIELAATTDVDLFKQLDYRVKTKFETLLHQQGLHIDPVGHEAWMPLETKFKSIYSGKLVECRVAEPVFVILSKAKKAPIKNRQLIIEYVASDDLDDRLFSLAEKYEVDLSEFVNE